MLYVQHKDIKVPRGLRSANSHFVGGPVCLPPTTICQGERGL